MIAAAIGRSKILRRTFLTAATLACVAFPTSALAWGNEGHETIALIARSYLTPDVRAKVDAILATDPDTLTAPDMASRSTWADAWRNSGRRETAPWHFTDIELASPDLRSACFGFPAPANPASAGPVQDCVVDKVREFSAELASPATPQSERILALKYLLHFVGDLHQPLHSSDNQDRGGNCVLISLAGARTVNLHAWWDTVVVGELGADPVALASALRARVTPAQVAQWRTGDTAAWAQEAFTIARATAYRVGSPPGCSTGAAPIPLPAGYDTAARAAAALQLERAGVRLAVVLNKALARIPIARNSAAASVDAAARAATVAPAIAMTRGRTPASLACSAEADRRELHGGERQQFRRRCIQERQSR